MKICRKQVKSEFRERHTSLYVLLYWLQVQMNGWADFLGCIPQLWIQQILKFGRLRSALGGNQTQYEQCV